MLEEHRADAETHLARIPVSTIEYGLLHHVALVIFHLREVAFDPELPMRRNLVRDVCRVLANAVSACEALALNPGQPESRGDPLVFSVWKSVAETSRPMPGVSSGTAIHF